MCWLEWQKAVETVDQIWAEQEKSSNEHPPLPSSKPVVKYTIPGPMTLLEGLEDTHYGPEGKRSLIEDTIKCIRKVGHQIICQQVIQYFLRCTGQDRKTSLSVFTHLSSNMAWLTQKVPPLSILI